MRIPIPKRVIDAAKEYAIKSSEFTHDHPGWENKRSKEHRLFLGKVAELCLIDFLKLNGKDIKEDSTAHTQNDQFDFVFKLNKYDVKTSYTRDVPMCITTPYEQKDIDYFVCTRIDFNAEWLDIIGVVAKEEAVDQTYYLSQGEKIDTTKYNCTFANGAYYYTGTYDDFFAHFEYKEATPDAVGDYWRRLALSKMQKKQAV